MTKKVAPKKARPNQAPTQPPPNAFTQLDGDAAVAMLAAVVNAALQTSAGVVAGSTGLTLQQAASLAASDTQHKTDVNVPELMTSLNGMILQQATTHNANLQVMQTRILEQASFFADLMRERAVDHADQNHTKQMLAVTFPFIVAGDAAEESADDTDK